MREIKFRAWDKQLNAFLDNIYFLEDTPINPQFVDPDWTFQQYTGLKDKNHKEIYEGDIFSIPPDRHHEEERNVVEYGDGIYLLEDHGLHLNDWNELGEIIGNIYENPELLGGD